ncbi:MAG: DUF1919 domain-containing protein [Marinobacter sp.]|uniref:DUF1919 domain-containing protein n=1 Tax=Marinobacter sp. TaxID=50741 RepID=UPI0032995C1D
MQPAIKKLGHAIEKFRLNDNHFVIISNNCWGYELYNVLDRQYNTPFVGLFLFPECYVRFLEDFETCIDSEIKFSTVSKYMSATPSYPVGVVCGDIEIHFLHYKSQEEAYRKWNRRIARLKDARDAKTPFFVKFCDRDGCEQGHLERFHALSFRNKISLGINEYGVSNHLSLPDLKDPEGEHVMDGLSLFRKRYQYFDISDWILSANLHRSLLSRILSLIS